MPDTRRERTNGDLVRLYLNDIGRHPLLTRADETRLAQAVEAGREARVALRSEDAFSSAQHGELLRLARAGDLAAEAFVTANLRLVVSIAKRYRNADLALLDVIQLGNLGLMHAVGKFDWRRGFKFSTYATWWIRQAIARGIADSSRTIRLPLHAGQLLRQVIAARAGLESELGRRPTIAELAARTGASPEWVAAVLQHAAPQASLSEPLGHRSDTETELGDLVEDRDAISPFDAAAASLLTGQVAEMLDHLDDRERRVLQLRFGLGGLGEPRTLEQVGVVFGVTRERVRQIEMRAISKLRQSDGCGVLGPPEEMW